MKRIFPVIAVTVLAALLPAAGRADTSFDVSLNTSALSGTPQILAFGLNDSDGSTNTVSLTDFNFGAGSAVSGTADCTLLGSLTGAGCSGDLTSAVTLTDTTSETFFDQEFQAGSSLSFELTTTNDFAGATPDGFAMYLCNSTLTACYSDDPSTGALLVLGLGGTPLTPSSFTLNGASAQSLPAPVVTESTVTPVPEPSSIVLLFVGFALLILTRLGRQASRSLNAL